MAGTSARGIASFIELPGGPSLVQSGTITGAANVEEAGGFYPTCVP